MCLHMKNNTKQMEQKIMGVCFNKVTKSTKQNKLQNKNITLSFEDENYTADHPLSM